MRAARICDQCHGELPADAPEGLCPKCLLRLGGAQLGIDVEEQGAGGGNRDERQEQAELDRLSKAAGPQFVGHGQGWPDQPRQRFGNYEVLEKIGQGGMGTVYKARQLNLDRLVALKLLPLGSWGGRDLVQRFRSEAATAAALQHPNIVAVHDVGEYEGHPFFTMDLVEGCTLAELVRDQPLPARRAAGYLRTIAEAVHYAHQQGILHRDLKPSNVLIDTFDQPRVTDFGLAKRLGGDSDLTLTGQVLGSPNFISPEQAEGRSAAVSPRSDVYSLGALLYHLLTRQPPFQAETLTTLLKQVIEAEPVPPRALNPSIPKDLETVCLKCLEKEPARRYATAKALAEDLGCFLRNESILARPTGPLAKVWKWCRRRPALAGVSGALILTVLAGLVTVLWQLHRTRASELLARRNAYAADMYLAQTAVENGDLGAAMSLLDTHRPAPGDRDLRGWEWRYLWQRCRSDELYELTHSQAVLDPVTFSPNGRWLAVRDDRATLTLWSIESRQPVCSFRMYGYLDPFTFSPTRNLLAYAVAGSRAVSVVDLDRQQELLRLPHTATVAHLGFSSDATRLHTVTEDGALIRWDLASGQILQQSRFPRQGFTLDPHWLVFSPDGGVVAFRLDRGLGLWELNSGRQVRVRFAEKDNSPTVLGFSPDGNFLAAGIGGADSELWVWEVAELWKSTGAAPSPRGRYGRHRDWICSVAFSPDSRALVSASADSALRVWELEHPETCRRYQGHRHQVLSVAWSPNGRHIVSSAKDGSVRVWDPRREPAACGPLALPVTPLSWFFRLSPDGKTGIELDRSSRTAVLWDAINIRRIERLDFMGTNLTTLAWAPDGRMLAATYGDSTTDPRKAGEAGDTIRIWDLASRQAVTNLATAGYRAAYVQFSHDGRFLWFWGLRLGSSPEPRVKAWRVDGWREIRLPPEAMKDGKWAAFTPDARNMVAQHGRGVLDVWDIHSGRCRGRAVQPLAGPNERGQVTISPNGHTWASSTPAGVLCLWDLTRELVPTIIPRSAQELWDLAFTPDGTRLLVSGKRASDVVRLLDPESGRFVSALSGKSDQYWFIRMTPDLNTIYAVGVEGALVWRAPSWAEIEAADER